MSNLIKFKFYENAIKANLEKQILAEHGVESFIANEQTLQSDWLLSQALGGIQLQVFENDKEKAEEILKKFLDEDLYSVDVEHTIENSGYDFVCPKCGSNHLYKNINEDGFFGISFFTFLNPFKNKGQVFHCYYCDNEFTH